MDEKTYEQTIHEILNNDYCGIETIVDKVFCPIFEPNLLLYLAPPMSIRATLNACCYYGLFIGNIFRITAHPIYIYDIVVSDYIDFEYARENLSNFLSECLCFANAFIIFHDDKNTENRSWEFYFARKSEIFALKESSFAMGKYSNSKTLEGKLCNLFANRDNITDDLISQTFLQESK